MRFVGIDIARNTHFVAIVDETCSVLVKPTAITEDATGYRKLWALLGGPAETLVVMEATGHYWRNLFAWLCSRGLVCAVVNPLRIRRFAQEDLRRAKTDRADALAIARFGALRRPRPAPPPDPVLDNLREVVRLRERLSLDFTSKLRQLHRLLALVFPEFTRLVPSVGSQTVTALLLRYPTARAFREANVQELAGLRCTTRSVVGEKLATTLVTVAKDSVAQHEGAAYEASVRSVCTDVESLREHLHHLDMEIRKRVADHPLVSLLITIDGVGYLTAARLLAHLGDPSHFRSPGALASYVGVVPATNQSGLSRPARAPVTSTGNADVRAFLWMPTLVACQFNPWLRAYYQGLVARGKPRKLAVVAAMRKLLTAVYSVAKHRRPFVPRLAPLASEGQMN